MAENLEVRDTAPVVLEPAAPASVTYQPEYTVETIDVVDAISLYSITKRLFDLVVSFLGIIVSLIPLLFIAVAVKLDSKGPVIYKQERLGKGGKPFMMLKVRSMKIDAEENGCQWAAVDDDRVTRVGRALRKTRMDELPQLFNILSGKMSFVGPRPERKVFYDLFEQYIHGFHQRLQVKPGLTGWAQINGGYDLKPEEKILLDIEYIKKRSILFDLKCLLLTVKVFFTHDGAR